LLDVDQVLPPPFWNCSIERALLDHLSITDITSASLMSLRSSTRAADRREHKRMADRRRAFFCAHRGFSCRP